ncbi:hypothetical protein EC957_002861 [Mortierella hygrophila]|uniref:Uncharacterized protein n=1 Tax=Mortierella hygrophila TaxID=979708 RepID=A0A9P6FGW2_9FUNG|nr:hypothetical protein EC957_002861 [Mortierella hygrophila]
MTTAFTSSHSYAEFNKKNPLPARPRLHFELSVDTTNHNATLENMMTMTDSVTAVTPPLDLTSDSDDEYSVTMRSPFSPTTPQPVSILLHRKRKDSQEEHVSAFNLFDRQRGQHDTEYAAFPAPQGYGKGARGRRPTVTFDLDDEPSPQQQHTDPLSVLHHDRHDDAAAREAVDFTLDGVDEAAPSPEVPDGVLAAEHALRRVSITHPAETSSITAAPQGPDSTNDDTTMPSIIPTTTTAATTKTENTTTMTATAEESITTSVVENRAPQEIIINHITAEDAPQDLLVALFDRPSELEALTVKHSEFFNLIYSSLSQSSREPFKTLLFTPRSSLGDRDWMQTIDKQLSALPPCILEKFKGIVGWIGLEDDEDERDLWGEDEYGYRDSSFEQVQIKWLRDVPDFPLETFEQCYPQFFVNARDRLQGHRMSYGGDQRDHYVIFREILQLSRDDLPCDNAWARRMNGCLEKHPELLLQLKEIVAYETGYDD